MGTTPNPVNDSLPTSTYQLTAMNCNKAMVLMSAAIDGELTPKEDEELAQHLAVLNAGLNFRMQKKPKSLSENGLYVSRRPTPLSNRSQG
jgi:hypothetical protein